MQWEELGPGESFSQGGREGCGMFRIFLAKSNYKPKNPLSISLIENFIRGEITFQIYLFLTWYIIHSVLMHH